MKKNVIFVFILSLVITLLNAIGLFAGILNLPINTVYLGTIHYFEDYFLYVNNFFQGAHGAWLTANRYTSEITPASLPYWTDLWSGKLSGLFGLSPIASYHVSLFILMIVTIMVIYFLLEKMFPTSKTLAFVGFLFAVLSTSLINHIVVDGKPMWYPFQLWRTPHFAFDRLGGVPHQILQSLIFFLLTIVCFSHTAFHPKIKLLLIGVFAFSLTTLNPIQAVLFFAAFFATQIITYVQKKPVPFMRLIVLFLVTTGTFIYMYLLSLTLPHSQARAWDGQQHTTASLPFLLVSIGPISILLLLGIIPSFMTGNALFLFALLLTLGTYGLFFSKIPQAISVSNLRIIFPALYPFMGAIAVHGVLVLAKKLSKYVRPMTTITAIVFLFILLSLPTLFWEIEQKIQSQRDTKNPTIYLPASIDDAFKRLMTTGTFDDVVLANPMTHMDTLVPALSGHTSYSGHMLLTIKSGEKQLLASQFFDLTKSDAHAWILANNIRYVLFTSLDGDIKRLSQEYPFLIPLKQSGDSGMGSKMGPNILFLVGR